jgi:hypothetical protein
MSKKSQREATFDAIISVLKNNGVAFTPGNDVKSVLTSAMKKDVRSKLVSEFNNGTIAVSDDFKSKLNSDAELNKYCSGLISNWVKKDTRLNGNTKYQVVNKGTRTGNGDSQVKELRKLLKVTIGTEAEKDVATALNNRIAQIKAEKSPSVSINADALPEHLRHLVK